MIDGSVLQSAQRCFEKKSRVVVKMVVTKMVVKIKERTSVPDLLDLLSNFAQTIQNVRRLIKDRQFDNKIKEMEFFTTLFHSRLHI